MNSKIKSNLFSIQHVLVALVLIPKGIDKIEHNHIFIGWMILLMGVLMFH